MEPVEEEKQNYIKSIPIISHRVRYNKLSIFHNSVIQLAISIYEKNSYRETDAKISIFFRQLHPNKFLKFRNIKHSDKCERVERNTNVCPVYDSLAKVPKTEKMLTNMSAGSIFVSYIIVIWDEISSE